MSDNELIMLVKEPFDGVRMTMPLDTVVAHGRMLRRRRRRWGLTGTAAVAGGLAAAVALLVPGGPAQPAKRGTAVLAAWTVTRDPDGGITVGVNQMKDPAGLQATLRADGVPARVTFDSRAWTTQPLPGRCTAPKMSSAENSQLQVKILTPPAILAWQQKHSGSFQQALPRSLTKGWSLRTLYINPAAIPRGIGLSIGVDVASPDNFSYGVDLTVTSPQCTGS